jgi:hypothetical protein
MAKKVMMTNKSKLILQNQSSSYGNMHVVTIHDAETRENKILVK